MKINKRVELGIKAIVFLKNSKVSVKTADIAEEIGTSQSFLEQIMRQLRIANLVDVKRGPGGGYTADSGKAVSAHEVALAVGTVFEDLFTAEGSLNASDQLKKAVVDAYFNTTI